MRASLRRWTRGLPGRRVPLVSESQRDSPPERSAGFPTCYIANVVNLFSPLFVAPARWFLRFFRLGFYWGLGFGVWSLPLPSSASPIPGLFNTGVSTQGVLLASGSVDPHYSLIQSPDVSFPGPNAF